MNNDTYIREYISKKCGKTSKQKLLEASQNLFKFSEIINDNQGLIFYEMRAPPERIIDQKANDISDPTKNAIVDCLNEILNDLNARANYGWENFSFNQDTGNFYFIFLSQLITIQILIQIS